MQIQKIDKKYYVNGYDLEEIMANRKYVTEYVDRKIKEMQEQYVICKNMDEKLNYIARLEAYEDIKKRLKLRK